MVYPTRNIPPAPWEVTSVHGSVVVDHRRNQAYFQPDGKLDRIANLTGKAVITGAIGACAFAAIMAALSNNA